MIDVSTIIRQDQDRDAMLKRILDTLVKLYTDKTHFIYELLQNAEDAHATTVRFIQHNNYLELLHDGLPFTLSNAKAICDAANSDKGINGSTAIGQFGVGFKAVFAICSIVRLYSEPANRPIPNALERFAIEIQDYTNPVTINDEHIVPAPFTTRFVFPYDHQDRYNTIDDLRFDIADKLRNLGADVMLFLKNIESISYEITCVDWIGDSHGLYMLEKKSLGNGCSKITSLGENNVDNQDSTYIMYSKPIENTQKTVDLVFSIDDSGEKPIFLDSSKKHRFISVYFPTETESKLRFLVQAPFATTPNRGGVLVEDNAPLTKIAAELLREVILDVKQRGWMSLEFLNLLPFELPSNEWLFKSMYDTTTNIIKNEVVLPTIDGDYTTVSNANIARGESLTKIFKGDILCKLLDNESAVWLPTSLTENNRVLSRLFTYLYKELDIPYRRADDLPKLFLANKHFLESMSDEWLESFYLYLSDELETLLQSKEYAQTPFIKAADGNFYAPFIVNGRDRTPNIFIRPKNATRELAGFIFVADFIVKNCIDFVEILKLRSPDDYYYFVQEIKEAYEDDTADLTQNVVHVKKAIKFLTEGRENVVDILKEYLKLKCIKADKTDINTTCQNSEIYFKTDYNGVSLYDYFIGTQAKVCILDDDYYIENGISLRDLNELHKIGINQNIYIKIRESTWSYNPVCWNIDDFRLHLDFQYIYFILQSISTNSAEEKQRSVTLLSLLKNVTKHLKGQWARNKHNPRFMDDTAQIVRNLEKNEWLFSATGELVKPNKISKYELDTSIYGLVDEGSEVYDILGFKQNETDENVQLVKQIINMDAYQLTNVIKSLPEEIKNTLLLELANDIRDDANEFDPDVIEEDTGFPEESINDLTRLRNFACRQYEIAPSVQYEPKLLRIRVSRGKDRENIGNRYKGYCQMCERPSRFWEVAEIFNNPAKELAFMNLSFCPTCASKYRRLRNDKIIMTKFAYNLRTANIKDPSALIDEDCITFTKAHLAEIQMVLELDQSIPLFNK